MPTSNNIGATGMAEPVGQTGTTGNTGSTGMTGATGYSEPTPSSVASQSPIMGFDYYLQITLILIILAFSFWRYFSGDKFGARVGFIVMIIVVLIYATPSIKAFYDQNIKNLY